MIRIQFSDGRRQFRSREQVSGIVEWDGGRPPERIKVRLVWLTEGVATPELEVVDECEVNVLGVWGRAEFSFLLPETPYSFSGKLVRLIWAVEAFAGEGADFVREEILVSPTGREIRLFPESSVRRDRDDREPL